jgi:hypothetical protein
MRHFRIRAFTPFRFILTLFFFIIIHSCKLYHVLICLTAVYPWTTCLISHPLQRRILTIPLPKYCGNHERSVIAPSCLLVEKNRM